MSVTRRQRWKQRERKTFGGKKINNNRNNNKHTQKNKQKTLKNYNTYHEPIISKE